MPRKVEKSFNVVSSLLHQLSNSNRLVEIVLCGEITAAKWPKWIEEHRNAKLYQLQGKPQCMQATRGMSGGMRLGDWDALIHSVSRLRHFHSGLRETRGRSVGVSSVFCFLMMIPISLIYFRFSCTTSFMHHQFHAIQLGITFRLHHSSFIISFCYFLMHICERHFTDVSRIISALLLDPTK